MDDTAIHNTAVLTNDKVFLSAILLFAICALTIAATPPRYTASAFIHVEAEGLAPFQSRSGERLPPVEDLILDQVASSRIIGPTVDSFGLAIAQPWWTSLPERRDHAISTIRNHLQVHQTEMPAVWELDYRSQGKAIDEAVFDDLTKQLTTSTGAVAIHERFVEAARHQFEAAANDGAAETSRLLDGVEAVDADSSGRRTVGEEQIADMRNQLVTFEKSRAPIAASPRPGDGNIQAVIDSNLATLQSERVRLAAQQAELSQRYGARHPEMIALDQERRQLESLIGAGVQLGLAYASQAAVHDLGAEGLHRSLRRAEFLLASDRREAARLAQMRSGLRDLEANYKTMLAQYARAIPAVSLHIIAVSRPSTPRPQAPTMSRVATLATALIAILVAGARAGDRARRRLRFDTAADVQRVLGVGVLAIIPVVQSRRKRGKLEGSADKPTDALLAGTDRAFEEAFRSVNHAFGVGAGAPTPQIVAICSALPNEGKTTVSACFARSAALSGCRVLLIDCDGRRSALSALFTETKVQAGLVQLLRGDAKVEQALVQDLSSGAYVIRHSSNGDIQDLSSPNPLKTLLDRLRNQFDLIILDTAPLLALTEARIIAANSDKVLLVARWRKTPVHATRLAMDLLIEVGANVSGVALTLARIG
ncbi:MAG: polysaccharide biosynthesis tyrosine autokinase [Caulobacteraceae bacterium]